MQHNKITLYAYFNIDNPMVAWEVAIGRVRTTYATKDEYYSVSLWQYSLLKSYSENGISQKFISELQLEKTRKKSYPNQVSRLQGLYFFENEDNAIQALSRWGIKVNKEYISPVTFYYDKITKVDSEWVTNYLNTEQSEWHEKYWQGDTLGVKPLTEVLALGHGIILNSDLRNKAYEKVMNIWPTSTLLLAMACCAYQVKNIDDIALMSPALYTKNDSIKGNFIINIADLDSNKKAILESIDYCKEHHCMPTVISPSDKSVLFTIPDLKKYRFEFNNEKAKNIFEKVHTNS